ncbi:MAG: SDR family oxidoreductase [Proteobacteria bacterium]|nr:SDR family oxidoreductase [Pseudomonadota bacterium]
MDLGIAGKNALLCASSRGLGKACAMALAQEGVNVTINGLDEARLEAAAQEIRDATGVTVTAVQADQTTEEGRAKLLAACPNADILVNNNAGPPPKDFRECTHDDYIQAIEMNMLGATMMIRGVLGHMEEQKFGRIVNITSAMVKHPFQYMGLSTSARSGLTALCKALSLQVAKNNVTLNNLLPERIDTDRQIFMAENRVKVEGITYEQARADQVKSIAAKRLGLPEEFGATCAFVCSAQASYMSGQNISLDGGSNPGIL